MVKINNHFLVLILLLAFLFLGHVDLSEGASEAPTYAMISVVDKETDMFPEHVTLKIITKFEDQVISEFVDSVVQPSQKIPIRTTFLSEDTVISVIALKEDYVNSESFTYTVNNETPQVGLLFEHTFFLEREHKIEKTIPFVQYTVKIDNVSHTVSLKTTETINNVFFNDINTIIIDTYGDSKFNHMEIIIPKEIMNGTFSVKLNKFGIGQLLEDQPSKNAFYVTESNDFTTLKIYFPDGQHQLGITATYVIPEFPTSQIIIVVGLIMIIILGLYFTKKKTNLQIPKTTSLKNRISAMVKATIPIITNILKSIEKPEQYMNLYLLHW